MNGQGLNGTVRLAAAGRYQRVDVAATANGARTPGDTPIIIQRGLINAYAILYPDAPEIVGDAQLAGLASGDLFVDRARVRINYRGGNGQAQLFAEGRRGVSFRVAGNAALAPAGDPRRSGRAGQQHPLPLRPAGRDPPRGPRLGADADDGGAARRTGPARRPLWRRSRHPVAARQPRSLDPQRLLAALRRGRARHRQPRFRSARRAASFPRAEARINIAGFTRTGIATRSVPVDMAFAGILRPEGGQAAAVIRRGGAIIGRMQARLQPLGPGAGSWMTRLLAAPLAGGVRYNGPADVPLSFANLPGHQLSGGVAIGVDFSGRVQEPQFNGLIRAANLTYHNEQYGTRITNLALQGRFDGSRIEIVQFQGRAGQGTVTGRGTIGLASAERFPIDINLQFENAQLARSDDLGATATGTLAITNGPQGALIAGRARARRGALPVRPPGRRRGARAGRRAPPRRAAPRRRTSGGRRTAACRASGASICGSRPTIASSSPAWASNPNGRPICASTAPPRRRSWPARSISSAAISASPGGASGSSAAVSISTARAPPDPRLALEATSDIDNVEVGINVSGRSSNPQIAFTSSPSLPQDEVVARILFGSSVTEISAMQAVQLAASLNTPARRRGGGLNPLGRLRSATGFTRIRILDADSATGRGTAVAAGMYLSDDIYVEIVTDAKGFTATQLEISLSRTLSLLSQFGSQSGSNVNLRFNRDY